MVQQLLIGIGVIVLLYCLSEFFKFIWEFFSFDSRKEAKKWSKEAKSRGQHRSLDIDGDTVYGHASYPNSSETSTLISSRSRPRFVKTIVVIVMLTILCLLLPFLGWQ